MLAQLVSSLYSPWAELTCPVLSKKYSEEHEWIEMDADGKIGIAPPFTSKTPADPLIGTIGITTYAAQQLGDVVYVELPEIGLEISQGDSMGAVESVKSASDIMTPVSGKIVDHNKVLEETPGKINKDPEGDAWLAKIEIEDVAELDNLMDKEGYTAFTEEAAE